MKTRLILFLMGVAVLLAGCFLTSCRAGSAETEKLSGNGMVTSDDQAKQSVGLGNGGSGVSNGCIKQQTNTVRYKPLTNGGGNSNGKYVSGFDLLSKDDIVGVYSNSDPDTTYNFMYIGRAEVIQRDVMVQIIAWAIISGGIGFVAGMLVFRNNSKKLEAIITDVSDDMSQMAQNADLNGDGKVDAKDLKYLADKAKSKIT